MGDDQDQDRERREDDRADEVGEPEKRHVGHGPLGEEIPRGVQDRGAQHEDQREQAHAAERLLRPARSALAKQQTGGPSGPRTIRSRWSGP